MSPVRIAVIILAALVGSLGLALFARTLAAPPKKMTIVAPTVIEAPMTRVLVAGHDLQPGDRLTAGDFTWQPWPQSGLNPLFITDGAAAAPTKAPVTDKIATVAAIKARDTLSGGAEGGAAAFVGAIVREPMLRGEPLLTSKVVKGTDAGILAVSLDPGMRAMAVPLSAESAAGGFILPGDHVDVVQSRKVDGLNGQQKFAAGSVLRNVKVMAIDQQTKGSAKNAAPAQIGATATLEVTPEQAELLALSKSQGELTLILRPFSEIAGGPSAGGGPQGVADHDGRAHRGQDLPQRRARRRDGVPMSRTPVTTLPRALRLALVLVSTAAIASPLPVAAQAYGQSSRLMGAPVRQAELGPANYGQTVAVDLSGPSAPVRTLALPRGKSATIDLPTDARDVVLSDPKVADVVLSTPRRIYVVGMGAGQTDAAFMDASGRQILRLNIRVDQDVSALGDTLNRLIPGSTIHAEPVNDSVVLTGEVPNASAANNAVRLATAFVSKPEQVVNMLSVTESEQVQLKVRVVEVNRTVIKQLGVNLNALVGQAGSAQFTFANAATWGVNGALLGGLTSGFQGDSTQTPEVKLYDPATNAYDIPAVNRQSNVATTQTTSGSRGLNKGSAILNAFERAGLVRSLAEPDLTVVSGEAGQYLVGGEFPVPVGQDNTGKVTIDFKKYGVGLGYSPVVLSKGRISLKLTAEVSELSNTGAFTLSNTSTSSGGTTSAPSLVIPGLSVRRVSTTVELPSGQSLMIAGLLQVQRQADAGQLSRRDEPADPWRPVPLARTM